MEKKIVWTDQAKDDLKTIYGFYRVSAGDGKAFEIVNALVNKIDQLYKPIMGSTRLLTNPPTKKKYQKNCLWCSHPYFFKSEK